MSEEIVYTEKNLFSRLIGLLHDLEVLKQDIKQAKQDFTYDEDLTPKGLSKDTIKLVEKAAKLFVAAKFEEVEQEALETFEKYKELSGYNE